MAAAGTKSTSISDSESPVKVLLHERDGTTFQRDLIGTRELPVTNGVKIISWNVAGLRGTLKKDPEVLNRLVERQQPDLLCLQETKLQNIGDFGELLADRGYKSYWTFSEIKKGYAGTVIFVKEIFDDKKTKDIAEVQAVDESLIEAAPKKKPKKQPKLTKFFESKAETTEKDEVEIIQSSSGTSEKASITPGTVSVESVVTNLPDSRFNGEGRWVQIETPDFYLINTYVPNSGQNLERLDYRCDEWDPFVRGYLNGLRDKKPVIYSGDLNVAHTDLDVYNYHAKHLLKQAGTTLREKSSFSELLSTGFRDSLRLLYPASSGQFTYWSQRTRARPFNKGLRLDYFVCSKEMFTDEQLLGDEVNAVKSEVIEGPVESVENAVKKVDDKKEDATAPHQVDDVSAASKPEKKTKGKLKRAAPGESPAASSAAAAASIDTVVLKADVVNMAPDKVFSNPRNVKVVDSYILANENDCSDHCPVVLILQTTPGV